MCEKFATQTGRPGCIARAAILLLAMGALAGCGPSGEKGPMPTESGDDARRQAATSAPGVPEFGESDIKVTVDGKDFPIDIPISCSPQMVGGGRNEQKSILVTWDPQQNVIQAAVGTSDGSAAYSYIEGDGNLRGDATLTQDGGSIQVEGHFTDVSNGKVGGLSSFTFDISCPQQAHS